MKIFRFLLIQKIVNAVEELPLESRACGVGLNVPDHLHKHFDSGIDNLLSKFLGCLG